MENNTLFVFGGDTEDGLYDSVIGGMCILHDRHVRDNLSRLAREEDRHRRYRFLPFWLIGWGDARKFLAPVQPLAERTMRETFHKELESMKLKAAYIRGVKRYIKGLYAKYGNGPISLKEVTVENLSEVIRRACENDAFYDSFDANITEAFLTDDILRNRTCEQAKNRLVKLL